MNDLTPAEQEALFWLKAMCITIERPCNETYLKKKAKEIVRIIQNA